MTRRNKEIEAAIDEYKNAEERYKKFINTIYWDYIVIIVNNKKQKYITKRELNERKKLGLLAKKTRIIVKIAPSNVEPGYMLLKTIKRINFKNKKILYIPSAGQAQRTLYYHKIGKIWIPVQKRLTNKKSSTIFDEILINTFQILEKIDKGMLVCCSDVITLLGEEIKELNSENTYVFSTKENMEKGIKHGVFKVKEEKVEKIFQKKSISFLKNNDAIVENNVYIDTGMILFPTDVLKIFSKINIKDKSIDLYEDIMSLFVKQNTIIKEQIKSNVKNRLEEIGLNVIKLERGKFIHFGTSEDILNIKLDKEDFIKKLGWNENFEKYEIKNENYLEDSLCVSNCKKSLIFNSDIDFEIDSDVIMYTTRLGKYKWITILYSFKDNIKATWDEATLFGKHLNCILKRKSNNMWNAKLYLPAKSKMLAIQNAKELYNHVKNNEELNLKKAMSIDEILKKEKIK